jgi:hypothetical protein
MEVTHGGLMASFIEKMVQPLNTRMGIDIGIDMASFIEKMVQPLKPRMGIGGGFLMASSKPKPNGSTE